MSLARPMTDKVAHRGPDGAGVAGLDGDRVIQSSESTTWQVALAHRRLSIIDLSQTATQPMVCRDRYWLTYNGEVYNYLELRAKLEQLGHDFRTQSDSEVLLAAFAEWGAAMLRAHSGDVGGLVLVDTHTNTAILCRDGLGMKPLYFWQSDGLLAVVSEIKQLIDVPGFHAVLRAGGN